MKNLIRLVAGKMLAAGLRIRSRPFRPEPGMAVVVAPHADDETLGCGGLIAARASLGLQVAVIFVSDSAGSPEQRAPHGQAAVRRAEALAALGQLGMNANSAHFLDAPDGRLNRLEPVEAGRVVGALANLLRDASPAHVFVPFLGGGSSEHDATVAIVQQSLRKTGLKPRLWEYPVWAWWDPRRLVAQLGHPGQNFRLVLGPTRTLKRRALACHASQCQAAPPLTAPALPAVLATLCTGPVEFYFQRHA